MRFLADENFPLVSVRALRDAGHDVLSIAEESPGVEDSGVMERATAEGRIILTFDRDFGELVYGRGFSQPEGIAYFRMGSLAPEEPAATLLRLLEEGEVTFEGNLTVVSRNRTRQRSL